MPSQDSSLLPPREMLVSWLTRLYRHRLTTTAGGNLSLIDDDGIIYITPSGGDKAIVPPFHVATRKPGEDTFDGPMPPSIEHKMHTEAYKSRRSCRAVLHAHSVNLIAFSIGVSKYMGTSSDPTGSHPGVPDTRCLLSAWVSCGRVAFVPYFLPGSDELAKACADALKRANCIVLQNHGVVTIGKSMQEAFDRFVSLEYLAQAIISATSLGVPIPLPESILDLPLRVLEPVELCPCTQCCCTRRIVSGKEKEIRSKLRTLVKRAYDHNLFTSSSGSISIRVRDNGTRDDRMVSFVISSTNVDRESLTAKDICYLSNLTDCASEDCHIGCHGRRHFAASWANSSSDLHQKATSQLTGGISTKKSSSYGGRIYGLKGKRRHSVGTRNASWEESNGHEYSKFHPNSYFHRFRDAPNTRPSHTAEIHHTIYATHPKVNCIIMAQPHYITSFCISGKTFNPTGDPESHLVLGNVPSLPFESLENRGVVIAQTLDPLHHISSVLVNGFGIVSVGESAMETYVQVEVCESSCGVLLTALRRGNPSLLNNKQVKEIDTLFHHKH